MAWTETSCTRIHLQDLASKQFNFTETEKDEQNKKREEYVLNERRRRRKKKTKTPNETETNNLPDKEFKSIVIRLLTKLGKRTDGHCETFNKELENIKKNQEELKDTITEMKNTPKGNNSSLHDTEEHISDLKD